MRCTALCLWAARRRGRGTVVAMADKLSRRLAALALLAATIAYVGWSFTVTVGDPDTSAEMAAAVLERPAVSELVLDAVAPLLNTLEAFGVPADAVDAIGADIVSDPRVVDAVADSIRDAHDDALVATYGSVYLYIPGDVITDAARDAAATEGLDPAAIPQLSGTSVMLPGAQHLGTAKRIASLWAWAATCALGAAILGALAAGDRARYTTRLAGRVAISATVIVAAGWVATKLTETTTNPVAAAAGAAAQVWRAATTPTVVVIAVVAAVIWAAAHALSRGTLPRTGGPRRNRDPEPAAAGDERRTPHGVGAAHQTGQGSWDDDLGRRVL